MTAARAAASASREAVLWLQYQPGENKRVRSYYSSFSPLTMPLPTLRSANDADSVNSETTGVMDRISETAPIKTGVRCCCQSS